MKKYLCGGGVRDKLLGLIPKDHDWVLVGCTNNDLEKLKAEGYKQVGADFPVFLHPVTGDEYALARVERKSAPGYHGFEIQADEFVTIESDLGRRDLTVNSIAMCDDGTLIDPYNGLKDLRNNVLRHTSSAFVEDPLRVLRLARFAARFSTWTIAKETLSLCNDICKSGELNHLSVERIWAELEKGFNEKSPARFMKVLSETGALEHCKVLNDMFGELSSLQHKILVGLNAMKQSSANKFVTAVSLLAAFKGMQEDYTRASSAKLTGACTRIKECFEALTVALDGISSSSDMVTRIQKVLKKTRVLQEGVAFEDFIKCLYVCELGRLYIGYTPKKMLMCAEVFRSVKASHFENLQGKDLGNAMEVKRLSNLKDLLGYV